MNQFEKSLGENGVGANVFKDELHARNLDARDLAVLRSCNLGEESKILR